MFEGRYSLAVSPEGAVILPPAARKELQRRWGQQPQQLLCFGVQFVYLCEASLAEALLRRIDSQLCAIFEDDMRQVNAYLRALERSIALVEPLPDGRIVLPEHATQLLGVQNGGLLTLLGVHDHLEIWDRERLERQSKALGQKNPPAERRALLETPICLQEEELPCSFLRGGQPEPRRCGPCVHLRLP